MLFMTIPKGFFPQEDIGQLQVSTEAPQDISFEAMVGAAERGRPTSCASRPTSPMSPRPSASPAVGGRRHEYRPDVRRAQAARTSARRCDRCLPICGAQLGRGARDQHLHDAGPEPAHRRRARPRASTSSSCRGSTRRSCTRGRRRWPMRWAATAPSPTSAPTCRTTPLQATLVIDRDKAQRARHHRRPAALHALFAASARSRSRPSTRPATATSVIMEFDPHIDWTAERLEEINVASASPASWCRSAPSPASSATPDRSPSTSSASCPP